MIKNILRPLIHHIKLSRHQKMWRRLNSHNLTIAKNIFPIAKVTVGKYTYGALDISFFGNNKEKVQIGSYCSIAGNVKILAGGGHEYIHLSTYPMKRYIIKDGTVEAISKGPVVICDDVWIGHGAIILSGVTIGQGAVIGAGSIVTKDVPPYAIYVGTRVIKYRFTQDVIDKLEKIDFCNVSVDEIRENINLFYSEISDEFFKNAFYNKHLKEIRK